MKIIKAGTYGMYDIFVGEGWYHHTRVQMRPNDHMIHIDGIRLNKHTAQNVFNKIKKGK